MIPQLTKTRRTRNNLASFEGRNSSWKIKTASSSEGLNQNIREGNHFDFDEMTLYLYSDIFLEVTYAVHIYTYIDYYYISGGKYMVHICTYQLLQLLIEIIYVTKLFGFILYLDKCLFWLTIHRMPGLEQGLQDMKFNHSADAWSPVPGSCLAIIQYMLQDVTLPSSQTTRSFYRCKQGPYYLCVCVFNIW